MTNMLFSELGATTVGMPVPAVPEALSQGRDRRDRHPLGGHRRPASVPELVENHTEFGDASLYTSHLHLRDEPGRL